MTQSLILKLKDAMATCNPQRYEKSSLADEEDEESNQKLSNIEIELEEIAKGVRNNLQSVFERGEQFSSLASKSESLKTISSGLKKKATTIR